MQYKNQFADVSASDRARTTIELPRKLEAQLKNLEPKTGVIQCTISTLLAKLSDELTKSNLTAGDRFGYQDAVAGCHLIFDAKYYNAESVPDGIQRSTATQPPTRKKRNRTGKAVSGNDGCGAASVARETTGL